MSTPPAYLLVSQVFPPAVGGSGVLLDNVYSRVIGADVVAIIDAETCGPDPRAQGPMRLIAGHVSAHAWGLFDPRAWPNQFGLASTFYRMGTRGRAIVHCGRAQPEAIPALLASLLPGGPRYVFWAHGEDVSAALSSRQFAATMRFVYGGASAAIANSRNTARLIDETGWHRGSAHVVYPGVDSVSFHPAADRGALRHRFAPNGELVLMSVARLQKRKGHDLVLRALPQLMKDTPALKYVVVGDGNERHALVRLAAELGVSSAVHFTGEVAASALPAHFAACDVFVLPTRVEGYDFEGFGLVFLEAAAAGKPSIGGRNGGVPEAVVEGETGLLVSGHDVEELAGTIRRLVSSPELRQQMGEAGRTRAVRDFTWERAAAQVSSIHQEVAERGRRRSNHR